MEMLHRPLELTLVEEPVFLNLVTVQGSLLVKSPIIPIMELYITQDPFTMLPHGS